MIVMGTIDGRGAKGVLSQADFAAINADAGLGKAVASVPTCNVMRVYNAVAKVIGCFPVLSRLYSAVNPNDG